MQNLFKKFGGFLVKNSPTLLVGASVAGVITTAVLAVKATPKALEIINNEQWDRSNKYGDGHIDVKDFIALTWKCYVPAAIMGGVTISCIIGANSINLRRNAALAGLYSLSETALKEYQAKVVETIGENKHRAIKEDMVKDRIHKNPVNDKEVIITGSGETLCYDALSGRYFKSDIEHIRKVINKLNRDMISDSVITLNEVYDELDLQSTKLGEMTGWHLDDGMIEPHFSSQLTTNGKPCLVLDFETTRPLYRD